MVPDGASVATSPIQANAQPPFPALPPLPALPQRLNFDLLYQVVNGQWRLQGIAIALADAPAPDAPVKPVAKSEPMGLSSPSPSAPTAEAGSKKQ